MKLAIVVAIVAALITAAPAHADSDDNCGSMYASGWCW